MVVKEEKMEEVRFVLNKFTKSAYRRLDDKFTGKKEEIEAEIIDLIKNDGDFRDRFIKYYHEIELGGRKHFFISRHEFDTEERDNIKSFIEAKAMKTGEVDLFRELSNPDKQFITWHKNDKGLFVEFKGIKKTYRKIKEEEKDGKLVVTYEVTPFHHIAFINFDFSNSHVIIGIDTYKGLFERNKEIRDYEKSMWLQLVKKDLNNTSVITSNLLNRLIRYDNTIVQEIKGNIDIDKGTFTKKARFKEQIIKDLLSNKYGINEIKKYNIDFDVSSHQMFETVYEQSISDGKEIILNYANMYWFTNSSGKPFGFRISFDTVDSSIVTYASHVFEKEVYDVISQCL